MIFILFFKDFDFLQSLQHDEPEMAKYLQASSNDLIDYLPQISVNTASKVLDNISTTSTLPKTHSSSSLSSVLFELSKNSAHTESNNNSTSSDLTGVIMMEPSVPTTPLTHPGIKSNVHTSLATSTGLTGPKSTIFKLDDLDHMHMSSSFKELCELLSIKKSPSEDQVVNKTLSPPLTPKSGADSPAVAPEVRPQRTSMRLVNRKQQNQLKEESMLDNELNPAKRSRCMKRKRASFHLEDDLNMPIKTEIKQLPNSNENSIDYSSDHIYYDDDEDEACVNANDNDDVDDDNEDDSMDSNSDNSSNVGYSKTRMIRCKKGLSSAANNSINCLDPIKKESNKEAATRYRLKKISEKDKLFETRSNLERENDSVKRRIESVQTEINYLKNILVQMILTKSLLNNNNNTN